MIKNKLIHWLKNHRPVLTTVGTLHVLVHNAHRIGACDGARIERHSARAAINPVIHDLERLRANTWDQDKITYLQNWLRDNFMEDTNYGQTKQD
ncbi:MAG: hypothetical protein IJ532_08040 [Alphaproteobacteria bacterium]|nr:hypothetical protein [Alphaproteobacteria bacterium]MBQ8482465.1 hypothetical protein [Alphaproteobacteria bacterium]